MVDGLLLSLPIVTITLYMYYVCPQLVHFADWKFNGSAWVKGRGSKNEFTVSECSLYVSSNCVVGSSEVNGPDQLDFLLLFYHKYVIL